MALIKQASNYPDFTKLLINDGTVNGVLTVASTTGLHVKQHVVIFDTINTPSVFLEIIEVLSSTQFLVGLYELNNLTNKSSLKTQDCSAFLTINGAAIRSLSDIRNIPEQSSVAVSAYETAPVQGFRVLNVDPQGNYTNTVTIDAAPPISSLNGISPQYGVKLAAQILGNTAGTATSILTINADRSILQVFNSLNQEISITYDGIECWRLDIGESFSIDCRSNALKLELGKTIGVFYQSIAPTTGSIRVTLV